MQNEYISIIKNIKESTNINEIKKNFTDIINILTNNQNKQIEKVIISEINKVINNYKRSFKKKYPDINNLYFIPKTNHISIFTI